MQLNRATFYRPVAAGLLLVLWGCGGSSGLVPGSVGVPIETALAPLDTSLLSVGPAPSCVEVGQPGTSVHRSMFEALNLYRRQNGLDPLTYSKSLERAENAHVRDLWERNFFDHVNPDGFRPGDRALEAGFCHEFVGENIAAGQVSVEAVMDSWKNSPDHDENMLHPDFAYVGMGFFLDPTGRPYWGQLFAFDLP